MTEEIQVIRLSDGGPSGVVDMLGTGYANNEPSLEFDQRIGRCFELAAYALLFGTAPRSARLVHGSWQGPKAPQRIRHAWLELDDGLLWEPIRACLYDADALRSYARMWDERTYSLATARHFTLSSHNYGPWHESRYP